MAEDFVKELMKPLKSFKYDYVSTGTADVEGCGCQKIKK